MDGQGQPVLQIFEAKKTGENGWKGQKGEMSPCNGSVIAQKIEEGIDKVFEFRCRRVFMVTFRQLFR